MKPPSPPPAPVPPHAELAKIPSEIEAVEEVQAARVPDAMDVQPTIEGFASINGTSPNNTSIDNTTINGTSVLSNGLDSENINNGNSAVDATSPTWAEAPPTPPTPVVAQVPFSSEHRMSNGIEALAAAAAAAPVADMGTKTEV